MLSDYGNGDQRSATYSQACLEKGECGQCSRQRNLSAAGREQALAIGAVIRTLAIPVGSVLASPLCRTVETAELMFGHAERSVDVRDGGLGRSSYPRLRALLSTRVPAGTNNAISGHGGQFQAAVGPDYHLDEGEGAIIMGHGGDRFKIVARITSDQWRALAATAAQ